MKLAFRSQTFRRSSLALIDQVNGIIATYQAAGFSLTLRQVYYQLVTRNAISNTEQSYARVGSILNDARLAGLIDWDAIEDRTRELVSPSSWSSPGEIVAAAVRSYQVDPWEDQRTRIEVWVEKDALVGVVERICQPHRVPFFSCRGYASASELYSAGRRFRQYIDRGQTVTVIHLGDHDPSGIDMTRDITERLEMFAGEPIDVVRAALNKKQIERFRPPPNPAKQTDSRFAGYRETYGDKSWELDALDPKQLDAIVTAEIEARKDWARWNSSILREEAGRQELAAVRDRFHGGSIG